MAKDYAIGLTGHLMRGAAGSTATTEITNARDVTLTLGTIDADTTSRASTLFESSKVILLNASLSFDMLVDDTDTDGAIAAIQTAWYTKAAIALLPQTENAIGSQGLDADWNITSFTRNEPLKDAMSYSVEAKPNNADREPAWFTAVAVV